MLDFTDKNQLLITIGIAAIIIEIILGAATGFDLFVLGVILIISGTVGVFSSLTVALSLIAVLAIVYIIIGRKMIKNRLTIATKATNVDNLVGREARVIKKIMAHKAGQVKIDGEIWRADSSKDIEVDEKVTIHSVSGVTVHVE